jgi:uncharacterized protein (TIGR02001 family)
MARRLLFIALVLRLGFPLLPAGAWAATEDAEADSVSESHDGKEVPSGTTSAEQKSAWGSTTANVGFTSDYIFRGQSQTEHQPAIQGGLDWTHPSGVYLGAWGSNVRYADVPATVELDLYGGYTYTLNADTNVSLGLMYYSYFRGSEVNTLEFPLAFAWKTVKLGVSYAPHWGGVDAGAWYFSAGWADKLIWATQFGITAGYSVFAAGLGFHDYADFRLSVSREMLGVTWDVSGVFVDRRQFNGADDPRVVLTASKSF